MNVNKKKMHFGASFLLIVSEVFIQEYNLGYHFLSIQE